MRSITDIVKQFKQNWTEELSGQRIADACRDCGMSWYDSLLNPVMTIQIFMLQILHGNTALTHMPHLTGLKFTAAAYCDARIRVCLEVFRTLLHRCVVEVQQATLDAGLWLGHRVFMVDGSSFSMSDEPELMEFFGQPTNQKPGCGFPVASWMVMMHMGTGMITKMLAAPLRSHEMSRCVELNEELQCGDVLLGDRAFCSFAHLCLLIERGVHAVLRVHQQTIVDFTPGRAHAQSKPKSQRKGLPRSKWLRSPGVQDHVVQWLKELQKRPRWMTPEQFAALPDEITVRELRYQVHQKGFRVKEITLVTTLLNDNVYSLPGIAALFRRRWEIETNFGHVKTTMKMDVLKCKKVEGVLKELHMFAIVYNLVRQVMLSAAARQQVPVNRISFIDALRWLQAADTDSELSDLVVLPDRPDRYEPRVRKRRPKKYKLMTEPRAKLKQNLVT